MFLAMPCRNTVKIDAAESYYHVYARGASKRPLFLEACDYRYFQSLFERYLSYAAKQNKEGYLYPHYAGSVELLAYCLMPNHFHLLLYQQDPGIMPKLMSGIMVSYSRYFNLKYKHSGSLFETRYKASLIDNAAYLEHISRYIHLNPRRWKRYKYSSLDYFTHIPPPDWLRPGKILEQFNGGKEYLAFIAAYENRKHELEQLKHELADT